MQDSPNKNLESSEICSLAHADQDHPPSGSEQQWNAESHQNHYTSSITYIMKSVELVFPEQEDSEGLQYLYFGKNILDTLIIKDTESYGEDPRIYVGLVFKILGEISGKSEFETLFYQLPDELRHDLSFNLTPLEKKPLQTPFTYLYEWEHILNPTQFQILQIGIHLLMTNQQLFNTNPKTIFWTTALVLKDLIGHEDFQVVTLTAQEHFLPDILMHPLKQRILQSILL